MKNKKVIVIGGGFAGLSVIEELKNVKGVEVTLIDRKNHHLFQPLLYQVAMAGLNPSEIAIPFRKLFSRSSNVKVLMSEVDDLDVPQKRIHLDNSWHDYDYLVIACGSKHYYFGNDDWESFAPGLKSIEQATEIRRRILLAFELAEKESSEQERQRLLTFVIVGGGPTGVELAGAISEMARLTLYDDFKNADLKKTKVMLVEAGDRILKGFPEKLSSRAQKDLEELGVEVILEKQAGALEDRGLEIDGQFVEAQTIIWAAGVKPSSLTEKIPGDRAKDGRVIVEVDLSLKGHEHTFVAGDQAAVSAQKEDSDEYLPGLAPVAMQEGRYLGKLIRQEIAGKQRKPFSYFDKGIMATIGRSRAVVESGPFQFTGLLAWLMWAFIHVAYLVRFRNKLFVMLQWSWSYFRFGSGARLIVHKDWRFYSGKKIPISGKH